MIRQSDRRIAQWQSASPNKEEAAAFDSCSAYQSSRDLLFLSHCVPNPPDKGERIRAFHLLNHLAPDYRIHLACFARSAGEIPRALELRDRCASGYVEVLPRALGLAGAVARFAAGQCLTKSFYGSSRLRRHVSSIARQGLFATLAYSSAVVQYAPAEVPLVIDMVDLDSEKYFQYAKMRLPGPAYALEGRRLRRIETEAARRASMTFFSTQPERDLFRSFAPDAAAAAYENGVDFDYFNPERPHPMPELEGRRFVLFTGAMDYYPNADACAWFAAEVFPELRRRDSRLEFLIVGRDPSKTVLQLGATDGITVTGSVPDMRPYLHRALAVVAPLRLARGIQNKALEALAMGKRVFASSAVCAAFGLDLPAGLVRCDRPDDFVEGMLAALGAGPIWDPAVRDAAQRRFSWTASLKRVSAVFEQIGLEHPASREAVVS